MGRIALKPGEHFKGYTIHDAVRFPYVIPYLSAKLSRLGRELSPNIENYHPTPLRGVKDHHRSPYVLREGVCRRGICTSCSA